MCPNHVLIIIDSSLSIYLSFCLIIFYFPIYIFVCISIIYNNIHIHFTYISFFSISLLSVLSTLLFEWLEHLKVIIIDILIILNIICISMVIIQFFIIQLFYLKCNFRPLLVGWSFDHWLAGLSYLSQ